MSWQEGIYGCCRITTVAQINGADLLAIFSQRNGGNSAVSLTLFAEWLSENVTIEGDGMVTQYAAPSENDFSIAIDYSPSDVWLILTPTATFAVGAISLPALADSVDKQEVLVNCTQIVSSLTVSASGANVTGEPASLAANDFFRMRFDAVMETWYRVG